MAAKGQAKDSFELDKKNALSKEDKSSKGEWDKRIIPLCDTINAKPDFYTSSSCAGRLVLLKIPQSGKKQDAEWLFTSHDKTEVSSLKSALKGLPDNQIVYRYEPFIIHVVCRDLEHAKMLLDLIRNMGLKRCGIISLGHKITIEIIGTADISMLIAQEGKVLVDDPYLQTLIDTSNMLLEGNWLLIDMLEKKLKGNL